METGVDALKTSLPENSTAQTRITADAAASTIKPQEEI